MNEVLHDPVTACSQVASSDGPFVIADAQVVLADAKRVIVHARFRPITAFRHEGFPDETVGIYIRSDKLILAIPHNAAGRPWLHCNQPVGDLCLWYTLDPRALQWGWSDGFEAYLNIVSRHLSAEEWYRRGHPWPFEDAPHGMRTDGRPHPIRTPAMRTAARRML